MVNRIGPSVFPNTLREQMIKFCGIKADIDKVTPNDFDILTDFVAWVENNGDNKVSE